MDTTLTVPASLVRHLRRGLYEEWGSTAEEISDLALRRGSKVPKRFYDRLRVDFNAGCAYLDTVGWKNSKSEGDVEINLSLRPTFILKALRCEHVALVDQLREIPLDKNNHKTFSARIDALEDFIKGVERQVRRLSRLQVADPLMSSAVPVKRTQTHRKRPSRPAGSRRSRPQT
jgi:hypothetical protein